MRRRLRELRGDPDDERDDKADAEPFVPRLGPSSSADPEQKTTGHPAAEPPPARSESRPHLPPAYWFEEDEAPVRPARTGAVIGIGSDETEELPVHSLPEGPRERRGPFVTSAIIHTLALVLLLISSRWLPEPAPPKPSELTIALQAAPQFSPPAASKPKPAAPPSLRSQPKSPEKQAEHKLLTPPAVPKDIPPATPLPPPTRMGELVPVPHLPVPGTVPPEEGKTGKPGAPGPKVDQQIPPAGSPDGDNQKDAGAGDRNGPGAAGEGASPDQGLGTVPGGTVGGIPVPKVGGGTTGMPGNAGGGHRRGLNMQLPPESGAFGDFSFEDKDYDWNDYYSQMYWSIWRAWHNRLYVMLPIFERWSFQKHTLSLQGTVLIRFVIDRSGTVSSIDVLEPSSVTPLDDSAVTALKEVILPRLPDDFAKDHEAVTGRFILNIDSVPDFRQGITYYKNRGIF